MEVRELTDEPQYESPTRSSPVAVSSLRRPKHAASRPRPSARSLTRSKSRSWINPGRAARGETAHRLWAGVGADDDAAIIDAYERAYNITQREGADGKIPEMPTCGVV